MQYSVARLEVEPLLFLINSFHICMIHSSTCGIFSSLIHSGCSPPLRWTLFLQSGRSCGGCLHSFGWGWCFSSQDQDHQAAAYLESDGMLLNLLQKTPSLHLCCRKEKTKSLELCLGQKFRSLTWKLTNIQGNLGLQLHCLLFSVGVRGAFGWFRSKTISLILKNLLLLQFVSPVFSGSSVYLFRGHKCKPS